VTQEFDTRTVGGAEDPTIHIAPVPRISVQAFCETPDVAAVLQTAVQDRRMMKAHVKINMGGAPAAVEAYRSAPTPNLIIIETAGERDLLIQHLDILAGSCDAGTKVVVIGRVNDILLYRQLMARGVSEYLVMPFEVLEFIGHISALYTSPDADVVGKIICVVGAKGGVGASTIAHNLGWSIATNLEMPTVIVDLDLPYGTAGLDFNQDPPQGIAEAVFSQDRVDANFIDRLMSRCSEKLTIMAAPATLEKPYDFGEGAFDQVLDILRTSVPCIILDMPHMWTAWSRRLMIGADELLIVAEPDLANLRNTKNLFDAMKTARPNDKHPQLLMNRTGVLKRPEISIPDFAKAVERSPIAEIPFDAKLFGTAANNGHMICEVEPDNKSVATIDQLARVLTGRSEIKKEKKSLLSPLLSRLRKSA